MSVPSGFMYASPEQVMKDRADYARRNIARGKPIVAITYDGGALLLAENPQTLHKISEIYDRVAFAAVGKYNEYENLRILGIRQADTKGYAYSREDVTPRSLANLYSQVLGQIFTDSLKPFEVELLIVGVGDEEESAELYQVTFDGVLNDQQGYAALGGQTEALRQFLAGRYTEPQPLDETIRLAAEALGSVGANTLEPAQLEGAILERARPRRKFRRLTRAELGDALGTRS